MHIIAYFKDKCQYFFKKVGRTNKSDLCILYPKKFLTTRNICVIIFEYKILGCRQAVRHQTLTLALVGSNPAIPAMMSV